MTMGIISFGIAFDAGKTRVPSPAAVITAFLIFIYLIPLYIYMFTPHTANIGINEYNKTPITMAIVSSAADVPPFLRNV